MNFFFLCTQGMDFKSNAKTNDGDINNFLYSGDDNNSRGQYALPSDPGSGQQFMKQPMNKPQSNGLSNASNANEKIAMLNKLKQQQKEQYERKKTQMTGIQKAGARGPGTLSLGGAMALEDMNLDRKNDFEGDTFDPFKIGQTTHNVNLQLSAQNAYMAKNTSQGGQMWAPEQMQLQKQQQQAAEEKQFVSNLDDLDDLEEI